MNKSIFISITAALLLCAVLCTASCVDAPADPIVGTYVTETDSSVSYAVFENGGTGYFAEAAAEETETGEDAWVLKGTCSWAAADSKNTYTLLFADGRAETAVLNAEHGLMTFGGVEYQKYPSVLSGTTISTDSMMQEVVALKKKKNDGSITPEEEERMIKLMEEIIRNRT